MSRAPAYLPDEAAAAAEAAGARFYTSVVDEESGRWRPLSGPWPTHAAARADLERVRRLAQADPRGCWYAYGVCSVAAETPLPVLFPAGAACP